MVMGDGWAGIEGKDDLVRAVAPEVAGGLDQLEALVGVAVEPRLVDLARRRIAMLLGTRTAGDDHDGLSSWPTSPQFSDVERAALSFTEQFVIDVAGVSDDDRASLGAALPADAHGSFVTALWVLDYGHRSDLALGHLLGRPAPARRAIDPPGAGSTLGGTMYELLRQIARLRALDPLTTELVRLRGARHHNCRLCKSLRAVSALEGGGDESIYDQVDGYEDSELDERHRVALRLTDAIVTQPASISEALVGQVREAFTPAETIELVYDVMRNSAQKVMVSLGVDDARVEDGIERYDVDVNGDTIFLERTPAAR